MTDENTKLPSNSSSGHNDDTDQPENPLSSLALMFSLFSLFAPVVIALLALLQIMPVPWDSSWPILLTFFGGSILVVASLTLSVVAGNQHEQKTIKPLAAIWIAVLAIPVVLAATWFVAMIGLANHPV